MWQVSIRAEGVFGHVLSRTGGVFWQIWRVLGQVLSRTGGSWGRSQDWRDLGAGFKQGWRGLVANLVQGWRTLHLHLFI